MNLFGPQLGPVVEEAPQYVARSDRVLVFKEHAPLGRRGLDRAPGLRGRERLVPQTECQHVACAAVFAATATALANAAADCVAVIAMAMAMAMATAAATATAATAAAAHRRSVVGWEVLQCPHNAVAQGRQIAVQRHREAHDEMPQAPRPP